MEVEDIEVNSGWKPSTTVTMTNDELHQLDKGTLIEKIISQQCHIKQLKSLLAAKLAKSDVKPSITKSNVKKKEFDFNRFRQRHIFLKLLYLGWHHDGFVLQENSANTIEDHIFDALVRTKLVESRQTCNYHRCGRTDKGVSAFGQIISVTVRSALKRSPNLITPENYTGVDEDGDEESLESELNYLQMLNGCLPPSIRIIAWSPLASIDISARFDCRRRVYHYYFPRMELDLQAMNEACGHLVGSHDFRHFCKMDIGNNVVNYIRQVFTAQVKSAVEDDNSIDPYSMCYFEIEASAYLWHQIRCIMSLLFLVGRRLEPPSIIGQLLDPDSLDQGKPNYSLASDLPLVLYSAIFNPETIPGGWRYGNEIRYIEQLLGKLHIEWLSASTQATVVRSMIDSIVSALKLETTLLPESLTFHEVGGNPMAAFLGGITSVREHKPLFERPRCLSLEERLAKRSGRKRIKLE